MAFPGATRNTRNVIPLLNDRTPSIFHMSDAMAEMRWNADCPGMAVALCGLGKMKRSQEVARKKTYAS
jgi:hypothetical protein